MFPVSLALEEQPTETEAQKVLRLHICRSCMYMCTDEFFLCKLKQVCKLSMMTHIQLGIVKLRHGFLPQHIYFLQQV
jgi:hypothetical protein